MKQKIGILIIGLLLIACKGKASIEKEVHKIQEQKQEKIEHLKTFAKVYGYVKYFHPSDEASDIDWNSFAAYGANAILKSDSNEIIATLNHLFNPIAPSVQRRTTIIRSLHHKIRQGTRPYIGNTREFLKIWKCRTELIGVLELIDLQNMMSPTVLVVYQYP